MFPGEFQGRPEWSGEVFGCGMVSDGGVSIGTGTLLWSSYLPLSWIQEPTDTGMS